MDELETEPKSFNFSLQSDDPVGLVVSSLLELRADITAMAVLVVRMHAQMYDVSLEDASEHYRSLKEKFALEHAFELQDKNPKPLG